MRDGHDFAAEIATPLDWALAYAAIGWPVVPCHWPVEHNGASACSCIHKPRKDDPAKCACGHRRSPPNAPCSCGRTDCRVRCAGAPCANIGKHPRTPHGLKDASTDPAIIRAWWARWPKANIAIVLGAEAGLFAFDLDRHEAEADGLENFNALCREIGVSMPNTPTAITGGNGVHYVLRHPGGEVRITSRGRATALRPGVEVKGDAAYIIAEPSTHKSGRTYAWEAVAMPVGSDAIPVADCPAALLELIADRRKPSVHVASTGPKRSYLETAFDSAGLILAQADTQGRVAVQCPWEAEHTSGSSITSTVLFPPAAGHTMGWFNCSHGHCAHRTLDDVLAELPSTAIEAAEIAFPRGMPPAHELAALWATCKPLASDDAMVECLRTAELDAAAVDVRGLCAVLPAEAEVPPWAKPWPSVGHRLIVPLFDGAGAMCNAIAVNPGDARMPWKAPDGCLVRTLAMADSVAQEVLRTGARPEWIAEPLRVVIVAGVRDWLVWAVNRALASTKEPYAVLGVATENIELEPAIAARIPNGARVIVRTPDTAKGNNCAAAIKAAIGSRCEVLRGKP